MFIEHLLGIYNELFTCITLLWVNKIHILWHDKYLNIVFFFSSTILGLFPPLQCILCICINQTFLGDTDAAAKSLQSCLNLYDPLDGSPPGFPIPGILQARTLEWVAISFSSARKWKVKVKLLRLVWLVATPWLQPTRLLCPWDFPAKSTGVGCHCLLRLRR